MLFCHPPRLENLVSNVVERIQNGERRYEVYWTKVGDRVLRVIIAGVRSKSGELLGVVEIAEDLTEVVKDPEKVKKRIMVL